MPRRQVVLDPQLESADSAPDHGGADNGLRGPGVGCDLRHTHELGAATIMMVDDDPTITRVIQMFLEDAGYRKFISTSRSTEAMELLAETNPDVVLLDLMMPDLSGFDILASMRADTTFAHVPVVILTSSTDASAKLKALELGANDFLAKPVDPSELVLRLRNNLAVKAYQDQLRLEQKKADRLLLNILPEPIAARLKRGETTIADHFDEVTVLFADLVEFTDFASGTDPTRLVERLNEVFQYFDELVEARGLEKIKTVGDSYMLAGGLPVPRKDHADAVVAAGLDMLALADRLGGWSLRLGVHTGPVVAGVIGQSKFNYDLWGDTVNVASRMESQGIPKHIQISQSTRNALTDSFLVEPRGPVVIKGKGTMMTYIVRGQADREPS